MCLGVTKGSNKKLRGPGATGPGLKLPNTQGTTANTGFWAGPKAPGGGRGCGKRTKGGEGGARTVATTATRVWKGEYWDRVQNRAVFLTRARKKPWPLPGETGRKKKNRGDPIGASDTARGGRGAPRRNNREGAAEPLP